MAELQAPRGMSDLLPEDEALWRFVRDTAERVARSFDYRLINTPIVEDVRVFARTSGDESDIVSKEMYVFEDRGGGQLALRPEGTASVCRAYLEHGMASRPQPVRLYYFGPMFRYDRPQAGRYRQLWQFGAECIGDPSPAADAEAIELQHTIFRELGLIGPDAGIPGRDNLVLRINSIGTAETRRGYTEHLREHLRPHLETPLPRLAAPLRDERAAHPRLEGRRGPPGAARGAEHPRPPLRRGRGALRRRALPARRRGRRLRGRPPHRARPRLLRAHRLGVRAALGGRRGRHAGDRRRRRTLRRPDRAARRPADARHRLRHGHRAHAAQPARARHRGPRVALAGRGDDPARRARRQPRRCASRRPCAPRASPSAPASPAAPCARHSEARTPRAPATPPSSATTKPPAASSSSSPSPPTASSARSR